MGIYHRQSPEKIQVPLSLFREVRGLGADIEGAAHAGRAGRGRGLGQGFQQLSALPFHQVLGFFEHDQILGRFAALGAADR